jgi:hypothetical protein
VEGCEWLDDAFVLCMLAMYPRLTLCNLRQEGAVSEDCIELYFLFRSLCAEAAALLAPPRLQTACHAKAAAPTPIFITGTAACADHGTPGQSHSACMGPFGAVSALAAVAGEIAAVQDLLVARFA